MKDEFGESDLDYEDDDPYETDDDVDSWVYTYRTWENDDESIQMFKDV